MEGGLRPHTGPAAVVCMVSLGIFPYLPAAYLKQLKALCANKLRKQDYFLAVSCLNIIMCSLEHQLKADSHFLIKKQELT